MPHAEHETEDRSRSEDPPLIRWRPWPCESCSGGTTALGLLVGSADSGTEIPDLRRNEQIDKLKEREAALLGRWVRECPHTEWADLSLPSLAEGSEHLVFFDESAGEVVKITRVGIYGDYYEIIDGRINQFDSTPTEYLLRMQWWEELFSTAPAPMGLTESGQMVSRQRYIHGDLPSQEAVDEFLTGAGLMPVRRACWLWKRVEMESEMEVWIGDARSDNFVLTSDGMVPIDIRVWGVSIPAGGS